MNAERLQEAVKVLEMCIIPLEPENKSIKTILDLARSYLSAIQSGVPEEKPRIPNMPGRKKDDILSGVDILTDYMNFGFNDCRSQILALVVQRDRRIAELDKQNTELVQEAVRQATKYEALSARCRDVEGIEKIIRKEYDFWFESDIVDVGVLLSVLATAISAWLQKGEGNEN